MIELDASFVLVKINTLILTVFFIYGFKTKKLATSELLILAPMLVSIVNSQVITQENDFYTFYLSFASNVLVVVTVSVFLHVIWQEMHSKFTYWVYGLLLVKFASLMLVHRVRTQIYTTDEPIMWLINGHSALILICNVLIISVLFLRVSKWNLRFMHFA